MESIDIIILGGGPAGLSTALHLAQSAPELTPRILILEKEHYPRPKLCGGGLVADAEVLLDKLGLDVSQIPHVDAQKVHFNFAGRGLTVALRKTHTLRIIHRDEFDAWLAEKARERGIEIREGVKVKDVTPDPEGMTVHTDQGDFHAKILVGADGSNGVTRRCVLPSAPAYTARLLDVLVPSVIARRAKPNGAISQIYERLPRSQSTFARDDTQAFFDFSPVPSGIAGYTWDFPTLVNGQPTRNWGIYDANLFPSEKRPPLKETLSAEMARHNLDLDKLELKGHPIRWFDPFNPFAVPRVLLVGDAAGADPLFGEGISMALGYGKLAAAEIECAFCKDDFRLTGYKRRVLMSPLGQTLIGRWVIAYIIYTLRWRWFHILLWWILKPIVILVAWIFVLNWGKRM